MNQLQDYGGVVERATMLAQNGERALHTGHLLLAVIQAGGVAQKTLLNKRLSERDVRAYLRTNPELADAPDVLQTVYSKAAAVARSVRCHQPSAIHLLEAMTTVSGCVAMRLMRDSGVDVDGVRIQALRNMTSGLTREHGMGEISQLKLRSLTDKGVFPGEGGRRGAAGRLNETPQVRASKQRRPGRRDVGDPDMGNKVEQALKKMQQGRNRREVTQPARGDAKTDHLPMSRLDEQVVPHLTALGQDLLAMALAGKGPKVVGRLSEMDQICDILNKKRANCPVLVGPPGVGKTAIVHGLVADMAAGRLGRMGFQAVIDVSVGALLSGTSLRGELGERLQAVAAEAAALEGGVLLFFDDVDTLLDQSEAQEGVNELKSLIAQGALHCIFATREESWRRLGEPLARLTTEVQVDEPATDETIAILSGICEEFEQHHQVSYEPEALQSAVTLSHRFLSDSCLPDKAVSVIDLAGARVARRGRDQVTSVDVAKVLAKRIDVPVERLLASDKERLLNLETVLAQDVVGHEHVLSAIGETLRRNAAGFRSGRPIGSFLFLGPTGVGKTETAKSLARLMFADEKAMIRLDMSEFAEPHALARLIGSPPGYVGHEDGGQLTDAVRKRPYSLVLLDEVEKAHRDVIMSLLQVLDDGRLTDGRGVVVDFANTVVIMTSNLGADLRGHEKRQVGFGKHNGAGPVADDIRARILAAARGELPPELWNRIDEPLVFDPLTVNQVEKIATLMLTRMGAQLRQERGIEVAAAPGVVSRLLELGGFDLQLGARPMRRTIARHIEGPVAKLVLAGAQPGDRIDVDVADGELVFNINSVITAP